MADIQPIKPIKLCVNITIPTIDDDSISLYECVGILGNKLQEAIQKINESLGSLEDVYTPENPPPYPVTSVNQAETKDVITVFEPEGGDIEDVSQAELIAACKAGARLGAFNQDNGTCRLYHFNLYIDPERVEYKEVAGGGASGVTSVNGRTGAVNIFNAPISAATAESVSTLSSTVQKQLNLLKDEKVNKSDALTLEEIEASTDLTGKIASASELKTLSNRFTMPIKRISNINDAKPSNYSVGFYVISNDGIGIPTTAWYYIIAFSAENGYYSKLAIGMTDNAVYYQYSGSDTWSKII